METATPRRIAAPWKTRTQADRIARICFSPDGANLAVGVVNAREGQRPWQVVLYETRTWRRVHLLNGQAEGIGFSPDGSVLATVAPPGEAGNGRLTLWRLRDGRRIGTLPVPVQPRIFLLDSRRLMTTRRFGPLNEWHFVSEEWDLRTLRRVRRYPEGRVPALLWPDGSAIAWVTADSATTTAVRDLTGSKILRRLENWGELLAVSHQGRWAVTRRGADDRGYRLRLWDLATQRPRHDLLERGPVEDAAFSPDGRWLATVGEEWATRLWDTRTGRKAFLLTGGQEPVYSVAFSPDGRILAAAGRDGIVFLWRMSPQGPIQGDHPRK